MTKVVIQIALLFLCALETFTLYICRVHRTMNPLNLMVFSTFSKHYEPHNRGTTQIGINEDSSKEVHHTIHDVF
jgi:hypothetical protein